MILESSVRNLCSEDMGKPMTCSKNIILTNSLSLEFKYTLVPKHHNHYAKIDEFF